MRAAAAAFSRQNKCSLPALCYHQIYRGAMARVSVEICGSSRLRYRGRAIQCDDRTQAKPQRSVTPDIRNSAVHSSWRHYLCAVLAMLLLLAVGAWGQNQNDVHVTPRATPASDTPKPSVTDPALKTHTKPLKVEVDLVLVPATVTDPMNRLVTGLDQVNFELYENGQRQD